MKTYDAYISHPAGGWRRVRVADAEGTTTVVKVALDDATGQPRYWSVFRRDLRLTVDASEENTGQRD